jgi:hypothetical protein
MQITEDMRQKAEWRARLTVAIASRKHDDATLVAMLHAGFEEAFSEGMQEAASLCDLLCEGGSINSQRGHTLRVTAKAIRELDAKNRAGRTEFDVGQSAARSDE